jgi:hypothetical protein
VPEHFERWPERREILLDAGRGEVYLRSVDDGKFLEYQAYAHIFWGALEIPCVLRTGYKEESGGGVESVKFQIPKIWRSLDSLDSHLLFIALAARMVD